VALFEIVDAEDIISKSRDHPHKQHTKANGRRGVHGSWRRDEDAAGIPKYVMPKVGIPSKSAYQLLHDETALDGNPLLNLAS